MTGSRTETAKLEGIYTPAKLCMDTRKEGENEVSDIVERLLGSLVDDPNYGPSLRMTLDYADIREAADLIQSQHALIEEMREALAPFAGAKFHQVSRSSGQWVINLDDNQGKPQMSSFSKARSALKKATP